MDATQLSRISAQVRQLRKARGLSQAQLAELAGVAPNTVGAIEGARSVRPGNLRSVLDVLDVPAAIEHAAYGGDVELVRDMVGQWLEAMPQDARPDASASLVRFILSAK